MINSVRIRQIIREEIERSLLEQQLATPSGPREKYIPSKGDPPLVKSMQSIAQRAQQMFPMLKIDMATLLDDDHGGDGIYEGDLVIAITGAAEKTLRDAAEKIRSSIKLPGNMRFLPGVAFPNNESLGGTPWLRKTMGLPAGALVAALVTNVGGEKIPEY